MQLGTMRSKFRGRTSGLSSDLTDSEVDAYLNRAYQYVIPNDVGGEYGEGIWELELTALTDTYPYASSVLFPKPGAVYIAGYYPAGTPTVLTTLSLSTLDVETDFSKWTLQDRQLPVSATGGKPTSVCFYGRKVYLSPTPDLAYVVTIPARMGPVSGLSATDGITDETHAMACVTASTWEFLQEAEDQSGSDREMAAYEGYRGLMLTTANGKASHRRPIRSYK